MAIVATKIGKKIWVHSDAPSSVPWADFSLESFGDINTTIADTTTVAALTTTLSVNRTWKLPRADAVIPGRTITVIDQTGGIIPPKKLIVARHDLSSDLVDDSTSYDLTTTRAAIDFTSDGISHWVVQVSTGAGGAGPGEGASGLTNVITQTTHGFVAGDILRYTGTGYAKAQADSDVNSEVVGLVSAVADANSFTLITNGYVTGFSSLIAGNVYFLSPTTAGTLTLTEPSAIGQVSKPILVADSATSGYFNNWRGLVKTSAGSSSLVAPTITASALTTGTNGQIIRVINAQAGYVWGDSIVATGSTTYLAWWNGSAWTVIGK